MKVSRDKLIETPKLKKGSNWRLAIDNGDLNNEFCQTWQRVKLK
jgi:hypothetical protein